MKKIGKKFPLLILLKKISIVDFIEKNWKKISTVDFIEKNLKKNSTADFIAKHFCNILPHISGGKKKVSNFESI